MRFADNAVVLTRAELEALLAFTSQADNRPELGQVLIDRRNCDTGIGRAVATDGASILVLEPAGTEDDPGTYSTESPSEFKISREHLQQWFAEIPEDTPHNEALAVSCAKKRKGSKKLWLSAAVVNYEEILPGRTVTLHSFDPVAASTAEFPFYERVIPRWKPADSEYTSGPSWLDATLFAKLSLVQTAVDSDHQRIRLQMHKPKLTSKSSYGSPVRFDSALMKKDNMCWAHGALGCCSHILTCDLPRPEER